MDFTTVLTNAGNGISLQTIFEKGDIVFNRIEIGNKINDNPQNSTALAGPKLVGQFLGIEKNEENQSVLLKFAFDNKSVAEAFDFLEFGIWATYINADGDEIECLYAYGYSNTGEGIEIPGFTNSTSYIKEKLNVSIKVGSPDSVDIYLGEYEDYASKEAFEAHLNDKSNPHSMTKETIGLGNVENVSVNDAAPTFKEAIKFENIASGEKAKDLWAKVKKAISTLKSHIENMENPHKLTWKQIFNVTNAPIPIEYGGTGVQSIAKLKELLTKDIVTDYRQTTYLSNNVYNNYDDGYWKQNGTAYIFFSGRISVDIVNNQAVLIMQLPRELRPISTISVIGQTNLQSGTPTLSIRICSDGNVWTNSFGYQNLPSGTFIRFQAVYPVN